MALVMREGKRTCEKHSEGGCVGVKEAWDLRIEPHVIVSVTRRPRLPFYGCAAQIHRVKCIMIVTCTYLQPAVQLLVCIWF